MESKINWGINKELQAGIRYEPNACRFYVVDISLGCPHHCMYCLFSPLEIKAYKVQNPSYKGDILPLKLDNFLAMEKYPAGVYLCYSSDPLGNQELTQSTITVVKRLLEHNVTILLISKGIFTEEFLDIIRQRPELMHIQVGMTSTDEHRNRIIEPGAPSYEKRLENLKKLTSIKGWGALSVRLDPLLPTIDDTLENVGKIIDTASGLGVTEAVIGYIILTKAMVENWKQNQFTRPAAEALTAKTTTISGQDLYSIPYEEKIQNLSRFEELCRSKGVKMSVCACKDEKLKETSLEWICHPFNRKKREEMMAAAPEFPVEVFHLK